MSKKIYASDRKLVQNKNMHKKLEFSNRLKTCQQQWLFNNSLNLGKKFLCRAI